LYLFLLIFLVMYPIFLIILLAFSSMYKFCVVSLTYFKDFICK